MEFKAQIMDEAAVQPPNDAINRHIAINNNFFIFILSLL